MMIDCAFFEKSRNEVRTYSTNWNVPCKLLRALGTHHFLTVLEDGRDEEGNDQVVVRGSHMMDPGNPVGLAQVNERFNITLPDDIDRFYRIHDGGWLLFRELYHLMPAKEIIETMLSCHEAIYENPNTPNHIIRFCDYGDNRYIALRLISEGNWVIMCVNAGYTTEELLNDEELIQEYTWDNSFSDWLKRMCETDGWPRGTRVYGKSEPPLRRIE